MPAVLAVIGLALLLAGFGAYRLALRPEPPAPVLGNVLIEGSSSIVDASMSDIHYTVDQLHPDLARVTVQVSEDAAPFPRDARVLVQLSHLDATPVTTCSPSCTKQGDVPGDVRWVAEPYFNTYETATAYFFVKAAASPLPPTAPPPRSDSPPW